MHTWSLFIQLGDAFSISFIMFCIAQSLGQTSVKMDIIDLSGFLRQVLFGNFLGLFLISQVVWNISLFEIHGFQRE